MRTATILLLLFLCSCNSKKPYAYYYKNIDTTFWKGETCYYRTTPVTNREYLLFLCWNIDALGNSHPDKVKSLFPTELKANTANGFDQAFQQDNTNEYNTYFLTPKYLDFPVQGLNKEQTRNVLEWLTDRYNEHTLIKNNYLEYTTPAQQAKDPFNLEAYLLGQYKGKVVANNRLQWADLQFLPAFRIPDQNETDLMVESELFPKKRKPFPMEPNHFLKPWSDQYLTITDKGKTVTINRPIPVTLITKSILDFTNLGPTTFLTMDPAKYYEKKQSLEDASAIKKDQFGRLPFVITGTNNAGKPIIEYPLPLGNESTNNDWIIPCFNR